MPRSKASPAAAAPRRRASASRPSTAVAARMPQPSACRCSPVRLMAESSTTSTRSPRRSLAGGSAAGIGASGSRSSNQNVDPAPGVLSTPIRPPSARPAAWRSPGRGRCRRTCASSSRRPGRTAVNSRVRPARRDADAGVGDREAQRTRRSSGRAPGRSRSGPRPRSVNLMALPTRLSRTWRRRTGSPTTCRGHARIDVGRQLQPLGLRRAAPADRTTSSATVSAGRTAIGSSSSLPASIFEKSRMSLMMRQQRLGRTSRTVSAYSRCSAVELACRAAARSCR